MYKITHANIKDWAKNYTGEPFDGILCDPPYELGFMGKSWDSSGIAFDAEMWADIYKLLKPGGHLLAFSGSRTYHRMAVAIEDAGFEIRDQLIWMYGSGFPKSLNIGKAVDKIQGNEREVVSNYRTGEGAAFKHSGSGKEQFHEAEAKTIDITKGTSEWEGYGTALKPAHEPCGLARKPLDGTVANNVLKHGTGGLNIDGTRIKTSDSLDGGGTIDKSNYETVTLPSVPVRGVTGNDTGGRFPANLIHDGSDEVEAVFPRTKSVQGKNVIRKDTPNIAMSGRNYARTTEIEGYSDSGSASRYFKTCKQGEDNENYIQVQNDVAQTTNQDSTQDSTSKQENNKGNGKYNVSSLQRNEKVGFLYTAKASKSERNAGLEGFEVKASGSLNFRNPSASGRSEDAPSVEAMGGLTAPKANHHPTVKPLSLTKYLATLIKPPTGGRLLVPFSGSGSEMIGALQAGWEYVEGVELTEEYIPIAEARIKYWLEKLEEESKQVSLI